MSWTQKQIDDVWAKAQFSSDKNEEMGYRNDQCTAWIKRNAYGMRISAIPIGRFGLIRSPDPAVFLYL
ncbi:hypothetical protein [Vibrio tapetis]|uniref:Uncharacterized protein n=1 Tax=Vibrio tapetis subsp. tapetis TaxID=1671868 RepID=A0A2N8ZEA2_9VIBR|nr:hypothetical protein [Vibrio tapetis]SON50243.1 protein of unknown function [Vibrio tapetis subsp. tapetis]